MLSCKCHICVNRFMIYGYLKRHLQKNTCFFWFLVKDCNFPDISYKIQKINKWPLNFLPRSLFFTDLALWARLVIELPCPCVCVCMCPFVCAIAKHPKDISLILAYIHKMLLIFFFSFIDF